MIALIVKEIFRHLLRNRLYCVISITGFSVAFLFFIIANALLQKELTIDNFHKKNTYRLLMTSPVGYTREIFTFHELPEQLRQNYPEINILTYALYPGDITATIYSGNSGIQKFYEQSALYIDSSFLRVFPFRVVKGVQNLNGKNRAFLSQQKARVYFKDSDPLNQLVYVNNTQFQVVGIFDASGLNTHLSPDMLLSYETLPRPNNSLSRPGFTYITLHEESSQNDFIAKLNENRNTLISFRSDQWSNEPFELQAITEVLFHKNSPNYLSKIIKTRDKSKLFQYGFVTTALVIIAFTNYFISYKVKLLINERSFIVKRIFGINPFWISFTLSIEATIILFCALVISVILSVIFLPVFNNWIDASLNMRDIFNPQEILIFIGLGVALSVIIGFGQFYFYFKGRRNIVNGQQTTVRKKITVIFFFSFQVFGCATFLIVVSIIKNQINFINTSPIGFERTNLLEVDLSELPENFHPSSLKNSIATIDGVVSQSVCIGGPFTGRWERDVSYGNESTNLGFYQVDHDFAKTLDLEILLGSDFDPHLSADSAYFLINETAARFFQVGKEIDSARSDLPFGGRILGIVKDFHYSSFRHKINPVYIMLHPFKNLGSSKGKLLIRVTQTNQNALEKIKSAWKSILPDKTFQFTFLSDDYMSYNDEEYNDEAFITFISVAILIVCYMGMFSVSFFYSHLKLKELAIRKILGASELHILQTWSIRFFAFTLLMIFAAYPSALFLTEAWLNKFAYISTPSIGVLPVPFLVMSFSLLAAGGYNIIKVVTASPTKTLKETR